LGYDEASTRSAAAVDDLLPEAPSPQDSLREWRERILNWVLYGLALLGVFAVIGGVSLRL
jgi:hypothetical protein